MNARPAKHPRQASTQQRIARSEVTSSPFAVATLVFFFASSGFALILDKVVDNSLLNNFILVAGPGTMWLVKSKRHRKSSLSRESRRANISLLLVACAACLSATAAIFDPALSDQAIQSCVLKTGGLIFIFVTMANCIPVYSSREVIQALVGFSLVESVTILSFTLLLGVDINANAIGVRVTTCGLLLFASLAHKSSKILALIGSLSIAFILQCRTSMVAALCALVAGQLEVRTRGARGSLFVLAIVAGLTFFVFGDDITDALRDAASANLHSSNPIARFFLSDKDQSDLSGDFLDRQHVWTAMWQFVEARPLVGYGIGTESALFSMRSHNAYLSLMIEGGAALLASWVVVYGFFVAQTLTPGWVQRFAEGPIGKSQVLLFSYLVLAALVESSGIGSISTPNNVIFLFLTLWVATRTATPAPTGVRALAPYNNRTNSEIN